MLEGERRGGSGVLACNCEFDLTQSCELEADTLGIQMFILYVVVTYYHPPAL